MLKEMAGLGFEWVELSHGIRITLVPGILRAVEEGVIKVASCHNFCPLPTGIMHAAPNLYQPTSSDRREREQWMRHSRRTVDFAHQVRARNLVLHLGSVEFFWFHPARKVEKYQDAHPGTVLTQDPAYLKILARAMGRLRSNKAEFWANLMASLGELMPYATQKGLHLGFENREKMEELPFDADFAEFIPTIPVESLAGYWHDTGHAHIKEMAGLLKHRQHLEQLAPRAIGFHLHDVDKEGNDHQPIGSGLVDFEMISEFWRPEHELVLEFSPRLSVGDVMISKERIEALISRRFG